MKEELIQIASSLVYHQSSSFLVDFIHLFTRSGGVVDYRAEECLAEAEGGDPREYSRVAAVPQHCTVLPESYCASAVASASLCVAPVSAPTAAPAFAAALLLIHCIRDLKSCRIEAASLRRDFHRLRQAAKPAARARLLLLL